MQDPAKTKPLMESSLIKRKADTDPYYNIKSWCDALDYTGVWRLGRIRKVEDNYVLVLFDGWSERWKQWYCKHSLTLAPVRTHTCGYTGQNKITLRDYDFDITIIKQVERKLKLLLADDKLSGFDALKLASFVRGDLFVLIDSILTLNIRIEAQECHQISAFMRSYLNMALKWMNLAPKTYQTVRAEVGKDNVYYMDEIRNNKLHVVSKNVSLYTCGFEIFISLKSIFGFDKRASAFYEKNTLTLNSKDLITHFLENQGLHKLNELLSFEDKEIPDGRIDFMLLWPVIYSIPFFLNKVGALLKEQPIHKFITIMYTRLKQEFESDPLFKSRLESNSEFVEFIHSLGELNLFVNGGEFLLDTLFDYGDADDNLSNDSMSGRITKRPAPLNEEENNGEERVGSVVIIKEENQQKKKQEEQEVEALKEQINSMQTQMMDFMKNLEQMKTGQKEFRTGLTKTIEEKIEAEKKAIKKEQNGAKNEYFNMLQQSGISPKELEDYLVQFKHISQKAKEEKDVEKRNKKYEIDREERQREDAEKYSGLSMGSGDDELKVLSALEMSLSNNKLGEALKLLKWRKKVIKLAQMNGWDVATAVANRTANKLDIEASDIILSNVSFLQKMERAVEYDDDSEEDEEDVEEEEEEEEEVSESQNQTGLRKEIGLVRKESNRYKQVEEDE